MSTIQSSRHIARFMSNFNRCLSTSATSKSPSAFISDKRYGKEHTTEEIASFVDNFHKGQVKDYQMTAWLMAVCLVRLCLDFKSFLGARAHRIGGN